MKKILDINANSTMNCFNFESFIYNILSTSPYHTEWIHENYINVFMKNNWRQEKHNHLYSMLPLLENIPGFQVNKIRRDFFSNQNIDIITSIQQAIRDDYYVYLYLDEYYLTESAAYKQFHCTHDSLVTGFDEDKNFYLFTYDKSNKLRNRKISYDEMYSAFQILSPFFDSDSDIFYYKPVKYSHKINLENIKNELKDYLDGVNTKHFDTVNYNVDFVYGIKTYEIIYNVYLNSEEEVDIRLPHKILEHKKILLDLSQYLHSMGFIESQSLLLEMEELEDLAKKIKLNTLKFNCSKNNIIKDKNKNKILDVVQEMWYKEEILIKKMLDALK